MSLLTIIIGIIGIAGIIMFILTIFDCNFDYYFSFITLIIGVLLLLLSYNLFKADTAREERKFATAIVTKTYESTVAEVQGVYKDKLIINGSQFDIDLNYSETKDLINFKPNDVVKVIYVPKGFSKKVIINIEKIK